MTELLAGKHWREAEADTLEAKEHAIDGALLALGALEGMFADRPELREHVGNTFDLLTIEAENLRKAAKRLRGEEA